MKISHCSATRLEHIVGTVWGYPDRGGLCNYIDADHFERRPYDAVVLALAPYVLRDPAVENAGTIKTLREKMSTLVGLNTDSFISAAEEQSFMDLFDQMLNNLRENYERAE